MGHSWATQDHLTSPTQHSAMSLKSNSIIESMHIESLATAAITCSGEQLAAWDMQGAFEGLADGDYHELSGRLAVHTVLVVICPTG